MQKHLIAQLIFLVSFINASAQNTPHIRAMGVCEVNFEFGEIYKWNEWNHLSDFKILSPSSEILTKDFSDFYYRSDREINCSWLAASIGFHFSNHDKTAYLNNPVLHFGVNYATALGYGCQYVKSEFFPYDTLTSSNNGAQYFIDSITEEGLWMAHPYTLLNFDLNLLLRTNAEKRFSLFAGAGLTAGASTKSYTIIQDNKSSFAQEHDVFYYFQHLPFFSGDGFWKHEEVKNKSDVLLSAYIPFGIDFRIGNKSKLLSRIHFSLNGRKFIDLQDFDVGQGLKGNGFTFSSGLKYTW